MEDAKRESRRVLRIERGFQASRIEEQVVASAYEYVLPILRCTPGGLAHDANQAASSPRTGGTMAQQRYATGG